MSKSNRPPDNPKSFEKLLKRALGNIITPSRLTVKQMRAIIQAGSPRNVYLVMEEGVRRGYYTKEP